MCGKEVALRVLAIREYNLNIEEATREVFTLKFELDTQH